MKIFKLLMIMMAIPLYAIASFDDQVSAHQNVKGYQIDKTVKKVLSKDYKIPIQQFFPGKYTIKLEDDEGERIGLCVYNINSKKCEKRCEVISLHINKEYQGKKIGTALMHVVIDHARKEECKDVFLSSMYTAICFYEKLGFREKIKSKYRHTAHMKKGL